MTPTLFRMAALLVVGAALFLLPSGSPTAAGELGNFELDGNAVDEPVAGDDWDTVNLGGGGGSSASTGVLADPAPGSIFTQGGSKDYIDIPSWRHKDGSVPDKDNITNAYAAAYNVGGDLVVYFGADRFANDGDAQLGFWFFQDNVTKNANGTFKGKHQVGDVLVLANFENGGHIPTIQILEWVGTGGDQRDTLQLLETAAGAECGTQLGDVCAITNVGPATSPWPYTPKQGTADIFPVVSFFEGGVNITDLFSGSTAPCFTSFLAETRSSSSVTAVLKDFVLGAFPVCEIEVTTSCDSCDLNADQTAFVYSFSGTVTNKGFGTVFDVTVVFDPGTPGNTSDDISISLGDLAGGASANYSGTFQSLLSPPTVRATASAFTSDGGPGTVSDSSETSVCPACESPPGIEVTKTCEPRLIVSGGKVVVEVTFSGEVKNTGTVKLENVTVTDDAGTPAIASDDQVFLIGDLAVGESKPYSGSYLPSSVNSSDPSEVSFSDTVTAEGDAVLGFGHVEDTDTATCPLCPTCP